MDSPTDRPVRRAEPITNDPSSFRDPAGFVFEKNGVIYRQINQSYRADYERLFDTGLYSSLVADGLLVPHEEMELEAASASQCYKVIKPERVEFISYPYEWCFGQLKQAALATVQIQLRALNVGMTLKDASAFNIQFVQNQARLIDTLSFATQVEGSPWLAYGQFCRHFLAPLLLMAHRDLRLGQLSRVWLDGIPLDLASSLLPFRTWLQPVCLMHLHLHAQSERRLSGKRELLAKRKRLPLNRLVAFLQHLEGSIKSLTYGTERSAWSQYQPEGHYGETAIAEKTGHVRRFIAEASPGVVWDLGANRGTFSRLAADSGARVVAFDSDPVVVDDAFEVMVAEGQDRILPLVMDLTNPSSGVGWSHEERLSLSARGPADLVLMLAVLHHLVLVNHLRFEQIARWCAQTCRFLVVEFVDPLDVQVKEMLVGRPAGAESYDEGSFKEAFGRFFRTIERQPLSGQTRVLYLLETTR